MEAGQIGWIDLTTPDAPRLRDFYRDVAGWEVEELSMGEYSDYVMKAAGKAVAGVCHQRGTNSSQPGGWMIYIVVEDLARSVSACEAGGGKVVVPVRTMGEGSFAIIEDPAGSTCALFQST